MLIAHRAVLQGMGALGHHQVGQVTDLWCMRRARVFIGLQAAQNPFMLNGRKSQGARAQKTARHPLALRQQQRAMHGALLLAHAPAAGFTGQIKQTTQPTPSQMQSHKHQGQDQ